MDELFLCRGGKQLYLYRAVNQRGQVWTCSCGSAAIWLRPRPSFVERSRSGHWSQIRSSAIIVKAVKGVLPGATHIRTGLHRRRGEITKSIERGHVAIRDRLRCSRGLKSVITGQRFLEGFEALQALGRGDVLLRQLVPGYRPTLATHQQRVRTVVAAMHLLGARLTKAA